MRPNEGKRKFENTCEYAEQSEGNIQLNSRAEEALHQMLNAERDNSGADGEQQQQQHERVAVCGAQHGHGDPVHPGATAACTANPTGESQPSTLPRCHEYLAHGGLENLRDIMRSVILRNLSVVQVLLDITGAMLQEEFVQHMMQPQEMYSIHSLMQVFERIVHSSIMHLKPSRFVLLLI